jgi:hypothetical protein
VFGWIGRLSFAGGFLLLVSTTREFIGKTYASVEAAVASHAPLSYWVIGAPVVLALLLMVLPGRRRAKSPQTW